jgi:predicted Zn-ribbon and HTH transcriptional regulator
MTVDEILVSLEEAGITLTLDGSDLVARPTAAVTTEMVDLLREHKAEVLTALEGGTISSKEEEEEAYDKRGLVAKFSREFGYILILDPTAGSWHGLHWKDAPEWARWEARKRKELWRAGDRRALDLTSAEMQRIWDAEHPPEPDYIVEEYPLENNA